MLLVNLEESSGRQWDHTFKVIAFWKQFADTVYPCYL